MMMQMNAMEKRAENSEKYLRRIAKAMVRRGDRDKRKRDGSDSDEEESLSSNEKWVGIVCIFYLFSLRIDNLLNDKNC